RPRLDRLVRTGVAQWRGAGLAAGVGAAGDRRRHRDLLGIYGGWLCLVGVQRPAARRPAQPHPQRGAARRWRGRVFSDPVATPPLEPIAESAPWPTAARPGSLTHRLRSGPVVPRPIRDPALPVVLGRHAHPALARG